MIKGHSVKSLVGYADSSSGNKQLGVAGYLSNAMSTMRYIESALDTLLGEVAGEALAGLKAVDAVVPNLVGTSSELASLSDSCWGKVKSLAGHLQIPLSNKAE